MRRPTLIVAVIVAAACFDAAAAPSRARGPWDLQTEAAAEAAVTRLDRRYGQHIQATVVSIPALTASGDARGRGFVASMQKLAEALHQLSAIETSRAVQIDLLRRNAVRVQQR